MSINPFKQESESLSPVFDPQLHQKIMRRVNQARIEGLPRSQGSFATHSLRFASSIAALIAVTITIYLVTRSPSKEPAQFTPLLASLKQSTEPINQQIAMPIQNATRQLTLMRDDAIDLGRFVSDQFNVLPKDHRPSGNRL